VRRDPGLQVAVQFSFRKDSAQRHSRWAEWEWC